VAQDGKPILVPRDRETRRNFSVGWSSGGELDAISNSVASKIAAPPLIAIRSAIRSAQFARRPQLGTSTGHIHLRGFADQHRDALLKDGAIIGAA
jgi:hypothetical protein